MPEQITAYKCPACGKLNDITNRYLLVTNIEVKYSEQEEVYIIQDKAYCNKNCLNIDLENLLRTRLKKKSLSAPAIPSKKDDDDDDNAY